MVDGPLVGVEDPRLRGQRQRWFVGGVYHLLEPSVRGVTTMAKVLAVGDTHLPAVHPGYLAFCSDLYDKYDCDTAVHIGDFVDHHAISAHDPSPEADGPLGEYAEALDLAAKWYCTFP